MEKTMDRRSFMQGIALAAAGTAGAFALAGCSPEPMASTGANAGAEDQETVQYDPVRVEETDIVVVGSGIGGFSAALTANEAGADVIMLEKLSTVGGGTSFAEVMFGVGSRPMREAGHEYSTLEVMQNEANFQNYRVNLLLIERLAKESGPAIDWFLDLVEPLGGGFDKIIGHEGVLSVAHPYKPVYIEKTGETLERGAGQIALLEQIAQERNIPIYLSCPARKLIVTDGAVTGVYAESEEGIIQINAKAVILACGGFGNNPDMIDGMGRDMSQMSYCGCQGCTGDALTMAYEAGAGHRGSLCLMLMGCTLPMPVSLGDHINQAFRNEPYQLWVNGDGRRFVTEDIPVMTQIANAMDLQAATWSIMDDATVDFYQTYHTIKGSGTFIVAGSVLDQTRAGLEEMLVSKPEYVVKGDTLEELAEKIGCDAVALKATVDRYNELCDGGEDLDYGKPGKYLRKIATPPFYAGRLVTNLLTTDGGVHIDEDSRVIDVDGNVIPGLFLAGTDADGFCGETYGVNLPGSAQGMGLTFGRIAAKNACADL